MTNKPRLSEFSLYPGLVEDVVDDLLSSDIISKNKVQKLKNDSFNNLDPNIVMDMRHKHKKDDKIKLDGCVESKLKSLDVKHNTLVNNVKCLKIIDKEIAKTRKNLYAFQDQLKKKNDSLMSSICNLEKKEEDAKLKRNTDYLFSTCNLDNERTMRSSPLIVNLNEDEINHYFNLHLDHLEEAVLKNLPKNHVKNWHPLELISPPIIKVTTTIKLEHFNQSQNEGLKIKELPEDIPISIKGEVLPVLSLGGVKQKADQRTVVPNNSPDLELYNSIEHKARVIVEARKEAEIVGYVINSWKYYIRKKKIIRFSEKIKLKVKTGLLKCVLRSWSLFAKRCKEERQSELNEPLGKTASYSMEKILTLNKTDLTVRKNSAKCSFNAELKRRLSSLDDNNKKITFDDVRLNKEPKLEVNSAETRPIAVVQTTNNITAIDFLRKSDISTTDNVLSSKKNIIQTTFNPKKSLSVVKPIVKTTNINFPDNLNIGLCNPASAIANTSILTNNDVRLSNQTDFISNTFVPKPCPKPMVSHRVITPGGVGLDNLTTSKTTLVSKSVVTADNNKQLLCHQSVQNKHQGLFANRYTAQEKIIAQQLGIIEKQKQIILDLKAKQLETQSKLSLKSAENQLAQAPVSFSRRLQPVMKTIVGVCRHNVNPASEGGKKQVNSEVKDNSEKLTKSLLERQEYCKRLAEMTKMRKILAEEACQRLKLEEEEKQKHDKEEERRLNILKIKKEKQLALEKVRKDLAIKLKIKEMMEKAISHRNKVLLKKSFRALQDNNFDIKLKTNNCRHLHQTNLLKRAFVCWKEEVQKSIDMKIVSVEKHYSTKLLINCWNIWRLLYQESRIKVQVSEDMFALKLQERMFRRWREFTAQQYLQTCCKIELAERLYRRQLLRQCFSWWRQLPKLMFVEREREQRRRAWRETVQQLIPDFSPVFAESDQLEV